MEVWDQRVRMLMMPLTVHPLMREYVARDPRTGRPIGTRSGRGPKEAEVVGPWYALPIDLILPLASGELDSHVVEWKGELVTLRRPEGILALGRLSGERARGALDLLIALLESDHRDDRVGALRALPPMIHADPDLLFDHLSVLLDDEDRRVQEAACECLRDLAPVYPSATFSMLSSELQHHDSRRNKLASKGLDGLSDAWPETAIDHIEAMLDQEDAELRRRAATSLRRLMKHRNAAAWDLLGWALADEDNGVRRAASKALGSLVNSAPALAAQFAERCILDADEAVRSAALRCLERLDRSSERVRAVILRNAGHTSIDIRRSCIQMLPSFIGEVELRSTAMELLRTEPDLGLQEMLRTFLVDRALEGTEDEKNAFLAPAEPVPDRDVEIESSSKATPTNRPSSTERHD